MKRFIYSILIIAVAALMVSCATHKETPAPVPTLSRPMQQPVPPQENPGSLFDPTEAEFLYGDNRAKRIGDIVVIEIMETSSSTLTADTTTERESTITFGIENWGDKKEAGLIPGGSILGLAGAVGATPMFKGSAINEHTGEGETKRDGTLLATLAGRVVQVHPGGMLEVAAAREIKVNDEIQILVISGLVRSRDITPANTISSVYMADAKIEYYGKGALGDKQKPGWMTRVLDNVWPF